MSEAVDAVGRMLVAYPHANAASDGYIGVIAALLMKYPKAIALECADPVCGIATTSEFLPTVAKIVAWLEKAKAPLASASRWDRNTREQLADRARREAEEKAEPLEHRIVVAERIKAELRVAGMRFQDDRQYHGETPDTVKAKLGLTDEQWAGIPDAPPQGHWEHLAAQHRGGND